MKSDVDREYKGQISYVFQKKLLGTGDAVKSAVPFLHDHIEHVLVLCGDVPLIRKKTLISFVRHHIQNHQDISVLAVNLDKPEGYGRIIEDESNNFLSIREELDATLEEKKINTVNSGVYCIRKKKLVDLLDLISTDNVQKEYYLTDLISISRSRGGNSGYFMGNDPEEVMGVNTLDELERAEQIMKSTDV